MITDFPLADILHNQDATGRISKWVVELGALSIFFKPHTAIKSDRRLNPDLLRGTVNLIGGELDVDDPRLRRNRTPQSLHHCSVDYHPCHINDLAMKAYPCKRNQEHKQEQEM
jgi:hypothetical protein